MALVPSEEDRAASRASAADWVRARLFLTRSATCPTLWLQRGEACMLSKISHNLHNRWGGQGTGGRALWVWLQVLRGVLKTTRRGS